MSNSTVRKIRIDQSHCNFMCSKALEALDWRVLFRDPGRVTRGGSGTQAAILGVFERHGLPLPDIAACREGKLLLIEVDKSARDNASSFLAYRKDAALILMEVANALGEAVCDELVIGFAKIGRLRNAGSLMEEYDLDMTVQFDAQGGIEFDWKAR